MIILKLSKTPHLRFYKYWSFSDRSRPPDFWCLEIGFLRIIKPIKDRQMALFYKMYLGEVDDD